jgi:hypothetical protein
VASDQAMTPVVQQALKNVAGVQVTGHSLRCQGDGGPESRYRGLDYCPFLQPVANAPVNLFDGPVGGDRAAPPLRVATNLPSMLATTVFPFPGNLKVRVLAELPAKCGYEVRNFEGRTTRMTYQQKLPAVVGGFVGQEAKGQVLVLADHSIFINEMMLPSDNGNVEFAYNCLEWLHHGSGHPRNKVLLIEDGRIRDIFNPLLIDPSRLPPESIPQIIRKLDEVLAKAGPALANMEQENRLNDWLEGHLYENFDTEFLPRVIVLSLAGLLLFYGFYRVAIQGRYRLEPALPLLGREVARHTPDASLVEQRLQAMLRAGNLWESAHNLARVYFTAAGVPLVDTPNNPPAAGRQPPESRPPRVAVEGSWWQRWKTRRRVLRLWRLAYEATPRRVSAARLRQLLVQLEELKAALAAGSVRLL